MGCSRGGGLVGGLHPRTAPSTKERDRRSPLDRRLESFLRTLERFLRTSTISTQPSPPNFVKGILSFTEFSCSPCSPCSPLRPLDRHLERFLRTSTISTPPNCVKGILSFTEFAAFAASRLSPRRLLRFSRQLCKRDSLFPTRMGSPLRGFLLAVLLAVFLDSTQG